MQVALLDSQPLLREALSDLMRQLDGDVTIRAASDLETFARLLREPPAPQLIIVGTPATETGVEQFVSDAGRTWPEARVIVLAEFDDSDQMARYFNQGVRGCIPRNTSPEIILRAVQLVLAGGMYIPPEMLQAHAPLSSRTSPTGADRTALTRRQREVLTLLTSGLSNKRISQQIGVTEGTVKLHVHAILKALKVSNRTEAALVAMDRGLVSRRARP